MAVLTELEYKIPEWAICIIEYGDDGGCTKEAVTSVDDMLLEIMQQMKTEYGDRFSHIAWSYGSSPYFSYTNDCTNYGDNVIDCILTVFGK